MFFPLSVGSSSSELQELTYSPEEEWFDTASSTQPDLDWSLTMSDDFVLKPTTMVPTVKSEPVRQVAPTAPPDKQYVVDRILETFPEAPIMVQVAMCESGLNHRADRLTNDGRTGIDVGLFQINQVHLATLNRLGLDRYDLEDNLTYARMLYDANGLRDWYMSEHCWAKYL